MLRKKLLAIAVSVALLVSSVSGALFTVRAEGEEWLYSADQSSVISGDNTDGYSVEVGAGTVYYNKAFDLTRTVFEFVPKDVSNGRSWSVMSITGFDKATNPNTDYAGWGNGDGINLMMSCGDLGNGKQWFSIDSMSHAAGFNPNVCRNLEIDASQKLTLEFRKIEGRWRLLINGQRPSSDHDVDFNSHMARFGTAAYVNYNNSFKAEGVRFVENTDPDWVASKPTASATTDAAQVTTLDIKDGAWVYDMTARDPKTTVVTMNLKNVAQNSWALLKIRDFNYLQADGEDDFYSGIGLMMHHAADDEFQIDYMISTTNVQKIVRIPGFDWNADHTFEFRPVADNSVEPPVDRWILFVDGVKQDGVNFDGAFESFEGKEIRYNYTNSGNVPMTVAYSTHGVEDNGWLKYADVTVSKAEAQSTLTFGASGIAAQIEPMDLLQDTISFQVPYVVGGWTTLQLASSPYSIDHYGLFFDSMDVISQRGGLQLIFDSANNGATLNLYAFDGGARSIDYINNFGWDQTHILQIVKEGEAYYLKLDGVVYKGLDLAPYVAKLEGKNTYLRWGSSAAGITIESEMNAKIDSPWVSSDSTVTVTGNETDGFAWSGNAMVGYNQPLDLKTQEVSMTADGKYGIALRLTNDYTALDDRGDNSKGITFFVDHNGDNMWIYYIDNGYHAVREVGAFDWSVAHTYGVANVDGKWYFQLDGEVLKNVDLTDRINSLLDAGNVYLQLTCIGVDDSTVTYSGIKFVTKAVIDDGEQGGDDEDEPVPEDWVIHGTADDVQITQSANGKYALDFKTSTFAAYNKPLSLTEDRISFQVPYVAGGWTTLQLANTTAAEDGYNLFFTKDAIAQRGGIQFIFDATNGGGTLNMYVFDGTPQKAVYVNSFAWHSMHTMQIVKEGEKYYLKFDSNIYRDSGDTKDYYEITEYVAGLEGKDVYLRMGAYVPADSTGVAVSQVGIMGEGEENYLWITDTSTITVSGNETDGYAWSGNAMVGYSRPLDFANEFVQFQMRTDSWAAIRFSNDYTQLGMNNRLNTTDAMVFILGREGNGSLNLYMWNNGAVNICYINEFDWDAEHAYGFAQLDGRWFFCLDGNIQTGLDLTDAVEGLMSRGDVFVQLTCAGEAGSNVTYSNIRFIAKGSYQPPSGGEFIPGDVEGVFDPFDIILDEEEPEIEEVPEEEPEPDFDWELDLDDGDVGEDTDSTIEDNTGSNVEEDPDTSTGSDVNDPDEPSEKPAQSGFKMQWFVWLLIGVGALAAVAGIVAVILGRRKKS